MRKNSFTAMLETDKGMQKKIKVFLLKVVLTLLKCG